MELYLALRLVGLATDAWLSSARGRIKANCFPPLLDDYGSRPHFASAPRISPPPPLWVGVPFTPRFRCNFLVSCRLLLAASSLALSEYLIADLALLPAAVSLRLAVLRAGKWVRGLRRRFFPLGVQLFLHSPRNIFQIFAEVFGKLIIVDAA